MPTGCHKEQKTSTKLLTTRDKNDNKSNTGLETTRKSIRRKTFKGTETSVRVTVPGDR
jgi:hypothetical protein